MASVPAGHRHDASYHCPLHTVWNIAWIFCIHALPQRESRSKCYHPVHCLAGEGNAVVGYVAVQDLTKLKDVNTVINDGDVISVIGPSGAGKSTLIRCINMLERPTGGQTIFDGTDITAPYEKAHPACL